MKSRIGAAILITLSAGFTHAGELYKWVDESGRVHYSDTKPETGAQTLNVDATEQFTAAPQLAAIPKPRGKEVYGIWVVHPEYHISENQEIGSYTFGGDCVSSTAMVWPEAQKLHPELFNLDRSESEMAAAIIELGYIARDTKTQNLQGNLRIMAGYSLWPVITQVEYQLCAPKPNDWKNRKNKRLKMGFAPSQLQYNDFSRHRVTTTVHWELKDEATGKSLFETVTKGSMDNWHQDIFGVKTLYEALGNATRNLFAQSDFVNLLAAPSLSPRPDQERMRTAPREEKSVFDALTQDMQIFQARKRAHFGKILSLLQPIKIMALEYFHEHGQWPDNFSALGLSNTKLQEEGYIESLSLRPDGSIVVNLDSETFGNNGIVMFSPRPMMDNTSMEWTCETNLEAEYWQQISQCKALP